MTDNVHTPVIETHVHFWDLANYRGHDEWLRDFPSLDRNFLPPDLKPHMDACGVDKAVIIEAARTSHALNLWLLELAEKYDYVGAVVAGCLLDQPDFETWLSDYRRSRYFCGIRTAPVGAPADWSSNPVTQQSLALLARHDLSLDLLVGFESFAAVGDVAAKHPSLRIIIDHCGSPPIAEGKLDAWRENLAALAAFPNVVVKYSSLLFYARPETTIARTRPVAEFLVEHFGPNRLLWGSNWPVELLGGSYEEAFKLMRTSIASLVSPAELAAIYGGNAAAFYHVST